MIKRYTLIILFLTLLFAISIQFMSNSKRHDELEARIVDLETETRIERKFNLYSTISYGEVTSSLIELEKLLLEKGDLPSLDNAGYQTLVSSWNIKKNKLTSSELSNIPYYEELILPSTASILYKAHYNVMKASDCECYHEFLNNFRKFLDGNYSKNSTFFINRVNKDGLEGRFSRYFILLQSTRYL